MMANATAVYLWSAASARGAAIAALLLVVLVAVVRQPRWFVMLRLFTRRKFRPRRERTKRTSYDSDDEEAPCCVSMGKGKQE